MTKAPLTLLQKTKIYEEYKILKEQENNPACEQLALLLKQLNSRRHLLQPKFRATLTRRKVCAQKPGK